MIFNGPRRFGVNLFPGGKTQFFSTYEEAKVAELVEVAKFASLDRAKEAMRLQRLGIHAPLPLSFRVSLADEQPGRKTSRRLH